MDLAKQLIDLINSENVADLQTFLENGCPVDIKDHYGVSPLQVAAANGFDDIVLLLLKANANVDLQNPYGWTPLMLAARFGHTPTVILLLKHGAKPNISNKMGLTAITAAVWSGKLSTVKVLLEVGAVTDYILTQTGPPQCDITPLMMASFLGYDSIVQLLLEKGASINRTSLLTGWTPLMFASCNGHKEIVETLIEHGANLSKSDICERTAMDIAVMRSHSDIKKCLLISCPKKSIAVEVKEKKLFKAVRNGNLEILQTMTAENPDVIDTYDAREGISVLIMACIWGHKNIVEFLVKNGANLDMKDLSSGRTAVMHAVMHKYYKIAKYLVDEGADLQVCANDGCTVLDMVNSIDKVDKDLIKSINAKMCSLDFSHPGLISTTAMLPLTSRRKSFSLYPNIQKLNPAAVVYHLKRLRVPQFRKRCFKGWLGDKVQKIFTRSSTSQLDSQTIPTVKLATPTKNDVFFCDDQHAKLRLSRLQISMTSKRVPRRLFPFHCPKRKLYVEPLVLPRIDDDIYSDSDKNSDSDTSLSDEIKSSDDTSSFDKSNSYENNSQDRSSKDQKPKERTALMLRHLLKDYPKKCISTTQSQFSDISSDVEHTDKSEEKDETVFYRDLPVESSSYTDSFPSDINSSGPSEQNFSSNSIMQGSDDVSQSEQSSMGGLSVILKENSLQKHVQKFKQEEIDMDAFKCLEENDFSLLGINSTFSQELLKQLLENLKSTDV